MAWIVVEDQNHKFPDRFIVEGERNLVKVKSAGITVIPADRIRLDSMGGSFCKQVWGKGWPFTRGAGERACPMIIDIDPKQLWIYWLARIEKAGPNPTLSVRLTADTANQRLASGGLSSDTAAAVIPSDGADSWIVGGRSRLMAAVSGFFGFILYGVGRDVAVKWSCVTQSAEEHVFP